MPDPLGPFGGVTWAEVRACIAWHRRFTPPKQLEAESHCEEIWAALEAERLAWIAKQKQGRRKPWKGS